MMKAKQKNIFCIVVAFSLFLLLIPGLIAQECLHLCERNAQNPLLVSPTGKLSDFLVPLLLGFSFGNLWLCVLLVFSLQTTNRSTCGGYLVGRAVAIVALSIAVAMVGHYIKVHQPLLNLLSGMFLMGFSFYLAATHIFRWVPPWKRSWARTADSETQGCNGHCSSCPTHHHPEYAEACSACGDDPRICSAEMSDVEPLTRQARGLRGRRVQKSEISGFMAGMCLGSLRGAALCSKLAILIPLLLGAPVVRAAGMGLTFSISSSVYPLLGFVLGAFALKLVRYKRYLFAASCVLLAGMGIQYLVRGLQVIVR